MSKKAVRKAVRKVVARQVSRTPASRGKQAAPVVAGTNGLLPEHLPSPLGLPQGLRLRPARLLPGEMQTYLDQAIAGGKYMIAVWAVTDEKTGTFGVKLLRNGFHYDYLLRARKTLDKLLLDIDPDGDPTQGQSVGLPVTAAMPATAATAALPATVPPAAPSAGT